MKEIQVESRLYKPHNEPYEAVCGELFTVCAPLEMLRMATLYCANGHLLTGYDFLSLLPTGLHADPEWAQIGSQTAT